MHESFEGRILPSNIISQEENNIALTTSATLQGTREINSYNEFDSEG